MMKRAPNVKNKEEGKEETLNNNPVRSGVQWTKHPKCSRLKNDPHPKDRDLTCTTKSPRPCGCDLQKIGVIMSRILRGEADPV